MTSSKVKEMATKQVERNLKEYGNDRSFDFLTYSFEEVSKHINAIMSYANKHSVEASIVEESLTRIYDLVVKKREFDFARKWAEKYQL